MKKKISWFEKTEPKIKSSHKNHALTLTSRNQHLPVLVQVKTQWNGKKKNVLFTVILKNVNIKLSKLHVIVVVIKKKTFLYRVYTRTCVDINSKQRKVCCDVHVDSSIEYINCHPDIYISKTRKNGIEQGAVLQQRCNVIGAPNSSFLSDNKFLVKSHLPVTLATIDWIALVLLLTLGALPTNHKRWKWKALYKLVSLY